MRKIIWSHLLAVNPVISTILVAAFGGFVALKQADIQANQTEMQIRQAEMQKTLQEQYNELLTVQTISQFLPYLRSDDDTARDIAMLAIYQLRNPELVGNIRALMVSDSVRNKVPIKGTIEEVQADPVTWYLYLAGLDSFRNGFYDSAITYWQKVLEKYPTERITKDNIEQAKLRLRETTQ